MWLSKELTVFPKTVGPSPVPGSHARGSAPPPAGGRCWAWPASHFPSPQGLWCPRGFSLHCPEDGGISIFHVAICCLGACFGDGPQIFCLVLKIELSFSYCVSGVLRHICTLGIQVLQRPRSACVAGDPGKQLVPRGHALTLLSECGPVLGASARSPQLARSPTRTGGWAHRLSTPPRGKVRPRPVPLGAVLSRSPGVGRAIPGVRALGRGSRSSLLL